MAGGTKRNHQPELRHAGDAMTHHDPIAVLLCRPVEASPARPVVPPQDRLSVSAEMFLVVMLPRQPPRAHASGHDLKRSAGRGKPLEFFPRKTHLPGARAASS